MAVTLLDAPFPNTPCYTQTWRRYIYTAGVKGDRSLHCGNWNFGSFLLLWPWPWPDDHIRTWPVLPGDTPDMQIELPTSRLSIAIVWQTYTYTHWQVTCGHFRSCDKDGGHAFRSAVVEKFCTREPSGSIFYRTGVIDDRSLHCGNRDLDVFGYCDLDLDPAVVFIDKLVCWLLNVAPWSKITSLISQGQYCSKIMKPPQSLPLQMA